MSELPTSRVRLGAYLSEGTTIMHEGFVNFNAGTLGKAMIEGRISAGVVIEITLTLEAALAQWEHYQEETTSKSLLEKIVF